MISSFTAQILIALLFLGGLIAFIGNYVGRYIGKRRLSIFNLRPRRTATIITIISGILIAVSTTGFLLAISQEARTALLGLERLTKEIRQKETELEAANRRIQKTTLDLNLLNRSLEKAKKEILGLQEAKGKLNQEVKVAREGQVLFKVGEVISVSLIQTGPEKGKIENGLKKILTEADAYVKSFGTSGEEHVIYMAPEDFDQAVSLLLKDKKFYVVQLVAARNAVWGEEVPARFILVENKMVYKNGDEIARLELPSGLSVSEIEQKAMELLRISHQTARQAGVLPEVSGAMGEVPYAQIAELARKVRGKTALRALAANNVYSIGPLQIRFKTGK